MYIIGQPRSSFDRHWFFSSFIHVSLTWSY